MPSSIHCGACPTDLGSLAGQRCMHGVPRPMQHLADVMKVSGEVYSHAREELVTSISSRRSHAQRKFGRKRMEPEKNVKLQSILSNAEKDLEQSLFDVLANSILCGVHLSPTKLPTHLTCTVCAAISSCMDVLERVTARFAFHYFVPFLGSCYLPF